MNDLMPDLLRSCVDMKKQALKNHETEPDVEMGRLGPTDEENLAQFSEEVSAIRTEREEITHLLLHLQELNEETKINPSSKVLRGLRDRMDSDMVTVLRKAKIIKARLEALDKSNVANRLLCMEYREGSPVDRTRMSVTTGLRIKVKELMNDFHKLREAILSEHKEGLKRKYLATGETPPSEEMIENIMILEGEQVEIFAGPPTALNLENLERQAVKEIEKSLIELHQVFLEMDVLVESQGEMMNDIEQNMARAGIMISDGIDRLAQAKSMKRSYNRWVYWICFVVFVLILIGIVSKYAYSSSSPKTPK